MKKRSRPAAIGEPGRILSYFKPELLPLIITAVSGLIYNAGMTAGPLFEGQLAQRLYDVINGEKTVYDMARLAGLYVLVILVVQGMRCLKRFYVRRFANNAGRNMRRTLYKSLVHKNPAELAGESVGDVMTRAVADVDACVEGMRKFTTEVFDTGVALCAYLVMLFVYDWRLALISCAFTPAAYFLAGKLRTTVTSCGSEYKKSAGRMNGAVIDRVTNELMYRVFGREPDMDARFKERLEDYERTAVAANIWESAMQPLYNIISMLGAVFIIWLGAKNVAGTGWTHWDIAAFTAFLSCFAKLAIKSSKAAKLFNSVQRAMVSWQRIKPLLSDTAEESAEPDGYMQDPAELTVKNLSFSYPGSGEIFAGLTFSARAGEIIGVTGPVACGKSTLGRAFLCESPYGGSIRLGGRELNSLSGGQRSRVIAYMGHSPELMSDTAAENVRLGEEGDIMPFLRAVRLDEELAALPDRADTYIGSGGVMLSGGQQARLALARTLFNGRALMILDDPFSAVDRKTEGEIFDALRRLCADKIVLLISHRLSLFPELDKVIWMADGKCRVSSHRELMAENGSYAALYGAQTGEADGNEK